MLENLFDVILQMSFYGMIAGAFAALLCILLRYLPCSRRVGFLLWAVVSVRLVCPFTVPVPQYTGAGNSRIGVSSDTMGTNGTLRAVSDTDLDALSDTASDKTLDTGFLGDAVRKDGDHSRSAGEQMFSADENETDGRIRAAQNSAAAGVSEENSGRRTDFLQQMYLSCTQMLDELWSVLPKSYLAMIWLVGVLVFWGFGIWDAYRLHKRMRFAMKIADGVYEVDTIRSSCVVGILRPRIYQMSGLSERQREYILCHEQEHIRHRDYIWKPLAYAIVGLHWFNIPLWALYEMFQNEMERYCDERVIAKLGRKKKEDYCEVLLQMAVRRSRFALSPLAFGENRGKNDMKDRIGQILNQKKHSRMIQAGVLAVSLGIGTLLLSGGEVLGAQTETEIETQVTKETKVTEPLEEELGEMLTGAETETEAEYVYKVTEYPLEELAKTLYELRNPYVGDASANGALLEALRVYLPDTEITQEIEAEEEPYRLILNMKEGPDMEEQTSLYQYGELNKVAAVLLALIDNVDEVVFSYPTEDEEKNSVQINEAYDAEWVTECYDGIAVKDYAQSEEKVLELLKALDWPLYFDEAGNALTAEMTAKEGETMNVLVDGNSFSAIGGADGPTSIFIAGQRKAADDDEAETDTEAEAAARVADKEAGEAARDAAAMNAAARAADKEAGEAARAAAEINAAEKSGYCVRDTECGRIGEHHHEEYHRNHRSVGSGD